MTNAGATFDRVIIGAGTAGCLLANRLSARSDRRVLLLEAGERDSDHWIPSRWAISVESATPAPTGSTRPKRMPA